jgi:hypothetical protein
MCAPPLRMSPIVRHEGRERQPDRADERVKLYRGRILTTNKTVEDRRARMDSLFMTLSRPRRARAHMGLHHASETT